jgi:hypothetical protein
LQDAAVDDAAAEAEEEGELSDDEPASSDGARARAAYASHAARPRFARIDAGRAVCAEDGEEEAGGAAAGGLAAVRASNATLRSEVSRHKADLEALKLKDPEFYKFLAATDSQLLAFQDSDGEEEGGEDDDGEDDEAPAKGKKGAEKGAAAAAGKKGAAATPAEEGGEAGGDDETLLTTARVDAWCTAAEAGDSLGSAARLLRGFRACAHYGDTLADEDERSGALSCGIPCAHAPALNLSCLLCAHSCVGRAAAARRVQHGVQPPGAVRVRQHGCHPAQPADGWRAVRGRRQG